MIKELNVQKSIDSMVKAITNILTDCSPRERKITFSAACVMRAAFLGQSIQPEVG